MLSRFSFFSVFKEHYATFYRANTNDVSKQPSFWEKRLHLYIPILIGSLIVFAIQKNNLPDVFITFLTTFLSIFCGLLFSFVIILKGEFKNALNTDNQNEVILVRETYSNTFYCIYMALFALLLIAIYALFKNFLFLSLCLEVLILSTGISFIFSLFIVLKRLYKICKPEI